MTDAPPPLFTPVHVEPAYHYEEAYHQCRDRMQENTGFLVALSINPAFPVPAIGAVLGVTAECVRRRLRLAGMRRKRGAPGGANHYRNQPAWRAKRDLATGRLTGSPAPSC